MTSETFGVTGMTCGHCVQAVTAEVRKLAGVASVAVDLDAGLLTVESEQPVGRSELAAAIDEAGFELGHATSDG